MISGAFNCFSPPTPFEYIQPHRSKDFALKEIPNSDYCIAYAFLPDDSPWKRSAKDVDLNPADQGKTFEETPHKKR